MGVSVATIPSFVSVARIINAYVDTLVRCRTCGLPDTWLCTSADGGAGAVVERVLCYACGEVTRISRCHVDACDLHLGFEVSAVGLTPGLRDAPL